MQTLMLLGLGFLAASLFAFLLAPFLWRYAVHATKQHIRQTSPLTMGEIQSDRDQLRAEHALTRRKLEIENEKSGQENKTLKIETAELKKRLREIADDISSHGAEIKTKDAGIIELSEERDRLKTILISTQKELKEAVQTGRREKSLSTRSATALKETNGLVKTKESELKTLKKSFEKTEKELESSAQKLGALEGHISRLKTCSGAVKSLGEDLLNLEKEYEKFLRTKFASKKELTAQQNKLLKSCTAFTRLEKSVRKQWSIASKAAPGGRTIFSPLKGQIDYLKASAAVLKKMIEKSNHTVNKTEKSAAKLPAKTTTKSAANPVNENRKEEDLSKRIRSLQDKLSA